MRDRLLERLFALFTSSDRAEAIAGDLVQERPGRGSGWFWYHAVSTAAALWGSAVAGAPVRTLLIAAAGCALVAVPVFAGVAAVSLFPTAGRVAWSLLAIFWWGGALGTGAAMVAIAPTRGAAACVTLAAFGEAVLLAVWMAGVRLYGVNVSSGTFYLTAAGGAWPLLIGAAAARARVIAATNNTLGQQS